VQNKNTTFFSLCYFVVAKSAVYNGDAHTATLLLSRDSQIYLKANRKQL